MSNINREHKDRLFTFIFGRNENKAWTLQLYNAINGSSYTDKDSIEINTMDDVVYMGMKNDVSFILHSEMNLYEQQSSYNPNMPVRKLMYLGRLYDKYISESRQNIYGSEAIELPVPKLVTFYNGTAEKDDRDMYLSDLFPKSIDPEISDVSVRVRMININIGHNKALMEACKPLFEYSYLVDEIRKNSENMDIEAAVDTAIDKMPKDYVIRQFLIGHKAEVKNMCITEYNEAETMELFKRDERRKGKEQERIRNLAEMLSNGGTEDELRRFLRASDEEIIAARKAMARISL